MTETIRVDDELVEFGVVNQPKRLTREHILEANDIRTETVQVPEWGGEIVIRGLTLREVDSIINLSTRRGKLDVFQSAVLTFIRGVVEPKFTDMDGDDLKKKSALVLRIVKEINRLSGITAEDGEDPVELAEKN